LYRVHLAMSDNPTHFSGDKNRWHMPT